ncbi:hypothetical protein NBH00_11945 [Paraconexibacter antarcticus]|uniref:FAD/NAD(P)-binding domain-containing protein n=1 Tax=Paraconexibacter antarcticus TaxID=2949664 RepID=A0ABY5DXY2_9ACTN|nr:FAD-dependent oxidoreductase [Paraconexibacter antarcticus]UTI66893.1 hypothetical protein NBH00_11945 [Paraconexibacter antarcticus]
MSLPRVLIVGAGPGGIAAAHRLRECGDGQVEIELVTRGGTATHLAGSVPVAIGAAEAENLSCAVALPGVRCTAGEVSVVDGGGAVIDGRRVDADAVIASPGLVPDVDVVPDWSRACTGWDLDAAVAAAPRLEAVPGGTLAVVVCGLPYRCPPAPYGLAMALARTHRASGRFTKVCVVTPEAFPLMGVGGEAPAFLMDSCAGAKVEIERKFDVDLGASEDGVLRAVDGRALEYELAFVIPPHCRSAMLADLDAVGPLVKVDARGHSSVAGVFVIGDAAATGLPRAADVAATGGRNAADAVLADFGIEPPKPAAAPQPSCYINHGGGSMSRIRISYPNGLPPDGEASVEIDAPTPDLGYAAEGERRRFLESVGGT